MVSRPSTKKRVRTERGEDPEHKVLGVRLRQLESEGKRGTSVYREASQKYLEALHRRLREIGCDLSDVELRNANKPDHEGEIALHKCVYEFFALASGARGPTTAKRMEHCVLKARALCEAGARVNHRNKYLDTPLLAAAQTDSAEIARVLVDYGADLSSRNRQGYTPLLMAASENRAAAVAVIAPAVAAKARAGSSSKEDRAASSSTLDATSGGYCALHWACINNSPKMVNVLLKCKADKNARTDPDRQTPLMKAAAYNAAACVEQLLRARCDAAAADLDGRNALHHAAKNKATLCVQLLISSGVPVDLVDHHNQKAIFYAAVAKSKACVTAISAATPNFAATPDAAKVKLLLQGKRLADDDDDDADAFRDDGSLFGPCFSIAGGCF
eukprot:CAMPEP_0118893862 /NCGR_PEP_ID=MMETSP1166-20130328/2897_1 /TAXON_ID=1104430 /ORGANISM="Chrysoreinhardia sp, Strain CCMP3193" /LENGTH=386 /DNA_ID=CAMNT_0006832723 /DNA_START=89 /DNA_END=1249 /DNA_ORIENTATION=+